MILAFVPEPSSVAVATVGLLLDYVGPWNRPCHPQRLRSVAMGVCSFVVTFVEN